MARSQRILLVVSVFLAGALGAWWASRTLAPETHAPVLAHGTILSPARTLTAIDLIDQSGRRFTQARFNGRWSIVYFGFTSCPMICPTTMAQLRDVAKELQTLSTETQPQVVLVTVDPKNDTPEVLGRYVATFNPVFLGLAGTEAALDEAARQFSVAHAASGASGTIDHSSTLYVVDPNGALVAVFTPPQTAAGIADDYRRLINP